MDTLSLLAARQSLRVYDDRQVPIEVRRTVLEAAISAPTAGALMLYSIIEIDDAKIKEALAQTCDNQPFIAKAPWVVLFAADYQRIFDAWEQMELKAARAPGAGDLILACCDALIAAQTAVVAAEAVGLGSCYIGDILENAEQHQELLNLPAHVFPVTLLCFGYAPPGYSRAKTKRLPLEAVLHKNTYSRKPPSEDELALARHALKKYNADFSAEMTRSVKKWLENWSG